MMLAANSRQTLKFLLVMLSAVWLIVGSYCPSLAQGATDPEVVLLNNEGVRSLNHKDYADAILKFVQALHKDSSYSLGHRNLAIAHHELGLSFQKQDPRKALKQFDLSLYWYPENLAIATDSETIIRSLGRDPKAFETRAEFGLDALREEDFLVAITEFRAALAIKQDADLRTKLDALLAITDGPEHTGREVKSELEEVLLPPVAKLSWVASRSHDSQDSEFMAHLQEAIKRCWRPSDFPESHEMCLLFKLHKNGSVTGLHVATSSGLASFDRVCMDAVKTAVPFSIPLPGNVKSVDVQFKFTLRDFGVSRYTSQKPVINLILAPRGWIPIRCW